jgi:hypothetical protein
MPIGTPALWPRAVMVGPRPRALLTLPLVGRLLHATGGRAVAQEVSSGAVASVVTSRSQTVSPCGTCGNKVRLG